MPGGYNREVRTAHANSLYVSLTKFGIRRTILVAYTDCYGEGLHYYIVDGQHLMTAIFNLTDDTEVGGFYTVSIIDETTKDDIAEFVGNINNSSLTFNNLEYLESHQNKPEYTYLLKTLSTQKWGRGHVDGLLRAFHNGYGKYTQAYQSGKFVCDRTKGEDIIALYIACVNLGLYANSSSWCALVRFRLSFPELSTSKIFRAITKNQSLFKVRHGRTIYQNLFEQTML